LAWVGSLAVAPIVWWVLGDLSDARGTERMFNAPEWLLENTHLYGVLGVLAVVSVLAIEIVALRLCLFARPFLFVFLPLVGAAAVGAFDYRVMTALVEGSNAHAGIAMLLGLPVAGALAVMHLYMLRDELQREHFVSRQHLRQAHTNAHKHAHA
jgi:hypothetical protein